jgi:hypothetical protein
MKIKLVPVYFDPGRDKDFDLQLSALKSLLEEQVEFLAPAALGAKLPEADAAVFPQLLGEAYRSVGAFQSIQSMQLPILILTSQFGTLSMWDWEILRYLKSEGVATLAPYTLEQTRILCNALRVKNELKRTKFLVYQDNPGEGAQASIFKRFYWWEEECSRRMQEKFGVTIVRRSFRELGARALAIPDSEAASAWNQRDLPIEGITGKPLQSALKLYLAVKRDLEEDASFRAVGINCLNESHFSDTTPCLAWNLLFQEKEVLWGCEADTVSMLTQYLLYHSLRAPIMMTNLYPFLLGEAALKHERIEKFPEVPDDPANYLLVAHCGYLGVIPKPFSTEWTLRKKVLAIVNDNATAIDARLPAGDVTLAKLQPNFQEMMVLEGSLTGYVQYPGSDCRNGGVIRVRDGHRTLASLYSHHYLLMAGRHLANLRPVTQVFGLQLEEG